MKEMQATDFVENHYNYELQRKCYNILKGFSKTKLTFNSSF